MTQTVFPFLHTPIEAPDFLEFHENVYRTGVATGSEVSAGSAGWLITIGFGKVVIGGSYIHDDADKIDAIDLGHTPATDAHYVVYQSYSYSATDPAATSIFAVAGPTAPPAQPVVPANSVKLADIYITTADTDINDPGVVIVNVPKVHGPTAVLDSGRIFEKLIQANRNSNFFTAGGVLYDNTAEEIQLADDLILQSFVTHNKTEFDGPSLVRGTQTGPINLSIPGTLGSKDCIVYCLLDRSAPTTAAVITLKTLDLTAAWDPNLADFYDPNLADQIFVFAMVNGSNASFTDVASGIPTLLGVEGAALVETPVGNAAFAVMKDEWIQGGFRIVDWDNATYPAGVEAALDALVPVSFRKEGMLVHARNTDLNIIDPMIREGSVWTHYPLSRRGWGRVSGLTITRPSGSPEIVEIGPGSFITYSGRYVVVPDTVQVDFAGSGATDLFAVWDSDDNTFKSVNMGGAGIDFYVGPDSMPFAAVNHDGASFITHMVDVLPRSVQMLGNSDNTTSTYSDPSVLTVANGSTAWKATSQFDTVYHALVFMRSFDDDAVRPKVIEIQDNTSQTGITLGGTVTVTISTATVVGVGTSFLTDFAQGDVIRANGEAHYVKSVTDDLNLITYTDWAASSTTAYSRSQTHGPHAWVFNVGNTFFTNDDMFEGLVIRGGASDVTYPVWQWGDSLTEGGSVPLLEIANFSRLHLKNLQLQYNGNDDGVRSGGAANLIAGAAAGNVRVTSLSGMHPGMIGRQFEVVGAPTPANNGWFTIADFVDSTTVDLVNASAVVPEATTSWQVEKNHDVCVQKVVTGGSSWEGIYVNGGSDLEHVINFGTGMSVGGLTANSTAGFSMRGCQFLSLFSANGSSFFYNEDASPEGWIIAERCTFHTSNLNHLFEGETASAAWSSGANLRVRFLNCEVGANVNLLRMARDKYGTINENVPPVDHDQSFTFTDCTYVGGATHLMSIASEMMAFNGCDFKNSVNLRGARAVHACYTTTNATITYDGSCIVSDCKFLNVTPAAAPPSDGINLDSFGNQRFNGNFYAKINETGAIAVKGLVGDFGAGASPLSRVTKFTGLYPEVSAGDPIARLRAETIIIFPNGKVGMNSSDETVNLLTAAHHLDGGGAAVQTVYYFYARKQSGDNYGIDALRFTTAPPLGGGRLPSGAEGGFTTSDYRYVGCLYTNDPTGADNIIWRDCRAVNYSNGRRRIYTPFQSTPPIRMRAIANQVGVGSTSTSFVDLNGDLATAVLMGIHYYCESDPNGVATTASATTVNGRLLAFAHGIADNDIDDEQFVEEAPRRLGSGNYSVTATVIAGGGGSTADVTAYVLYFDEDINETTYPLYENDNGNP